MSPLLVETLLMTGMMILAVLLLRAPVARMFGARAAYALWLAPLGRMVWPLLPSLPARPAAPQVPDDSLILVTLEPAVRAVSALPAMLWVVWGAGAVLYLAARLFAHHRFLARALAEGRPLPGRIDADLIATSAVEGPLATGLIHRLVLVPADFDTRFTPEQQRLALAHEELHHRRGDLWACSAALLLTALNWFNPLAHLALAAFRRDMEAACDAQLLAEGKGEAAPYAETLLRCAARPVPRSLCALTSIDELKGRLTMLANTPTRLRRLAGTLIALGLTGGGIAASLPAAADPGLPIHGTYATLSVAPDGTASGTLQEAPKAGTPVRKEIRVVETVGGDKLSEADRAQMEKMAAAGKCPDGSDAITADSGEKKSGDGKVEKSRIMICTKGGAGSADAAQGLEKALARIQADSDMDPAIKAEVVAKLQARIAETKK